MSRASAQAASQARTAAPLFAALGDETRLQLLVRLSRQGPESIAQMSAESAVSRQAVTKHLRVLADAGFVSGERRGREHIWALRPGRLDEVRQHLERISVQWDDALARLQAHVEG